MFSSKSPPDGLPPDGTSPDGEDGSDVGDELELGRPRARRRRALVLAAGAAVVALGGGGLLIRARSKTDDEARAAELGQQAYAALRDGATRRAVKLATEARALSPSSREVAQAWLHATGLDLLEGDATALRAVGFIDEVRGLGARGPDIAFAMLVSATVIKNDRLARRLLEQHELQGIVTDAYYEYAAGAALDLDCDAVAEERFERSAERWVDAKLPKLRRARSLACVGRFEEARAELDAISPPDAATKVARDIVHALEMPRAARPAVDPFALTDLPKSLQPLAQALTVSEDNAQAGLDAALADVDSPMIAVACADIAVGARDFASAERALEVALQMRREYAHAAERLVRLRVLNGDLARADEAAQASGDTASLALLVAIHAYEDRKLEELKRALEDASSVPTWSLGPAARGMLGDGPRPTLDELKRAVDAGVPWADMLYVDAALESGNPDDAKKVAAAWVSDSAPRERRRKLLEGRAPKRP